MKALFVWLALFALLLVSCMPKSTGTLPATQLPATMATAASALTITPAPSMTTLPITSQTNTPTVVPAPTHTVPTSFKSLSEDSIIMLIGDLRDEGPPTPWLTTLKHRIVVATESGVDTVLIVFRTSSVERTFEELDQLVEEARSRGIGVIPRIVVNSNTFRELIRVTSASQPDSLPDYTNPEQLQYGVKLLEKVIRHLEEFPNIIAYQIEWGHYGESWINAPFWDSASSKKAFLEFLSSLSPEFARFNETNLTNWIRGDEMYYCPFLSKGDPRRDQLNVAEFYWYQKWRNETTKKITWTFRETAKRLTEKPIIGFSYVVAGPSGAIGYTYTAQKYLDAAFSDWVPYPYSARKYFIRDAYFPGLHLGELDFDTPYFAKENAERAIANMYARGIVPVIFYPQWSRALTDRDIPVLVEYMNKHKVSIKRMKHASILIVFGHTDVGVMDLNRPDVVVGGGIPFWWDQPPGLLAAMLSKGLLVDVVSPDVYTPDLGELYQVVIVVVPHDGLDGDFQKRLTRTSTNVIVVHPSFIVSTPTPTLPTAVKSAYCGYWNTVRLGGREIGVQVWGTGPGLHNPSVRFSGTLASLGTLNNYTPNHIFSYYKGDFDEVYATALFPEAAFPVIARLGNFWFFGLDTHLFDDIQREISQKAFLSILQGLGIEIR
jgi:hypothetical protein